MADGVEIMSDGVRSVAPAASPSLLVGTVKARNGGRGPELWLREPDETDILDQKIRKFMWHLYCKFSYD